MGVIIVKRILINLLLFAIIAILVFLVLWKPAKIYKINIFEEVKNEIIIINEVDNNLDNAVPKGIDEQ